MQLVQCDGRRGRGSRAGCGACYNAASRGRRVGRGPRLAAPARLRLGDRPTALLRTTPGRNAPSTYLRSCVSGGGGSSNTWSTEPPSRPTEVVVHLVHGEQKLNIGPGSLHLRHTPSQVDEIEFAPGQSDVRAKGDPAGLRASRHGAYLARRGILGGDTGGTGDPRLAGHPRRAILVWSTWPEPSWRRRRGKSPSARRADGRQLPRRRPRSRRFLSCIGRSPRIRCTASGLALQSGRVRRSESSTNLSCASTKGK